MVPPRTIRSILRTLHAVQRMLLLPALLLLDTRCCCRCVIAASCCQVTVKAALFLLFPSVLRRCMERLCLFFLHLLLLRLAHLALGLDVVLLDLADLHSTQQPGIKFRLLLFAQGDVRGYQRTRPIMQSQPMPHLPIACYYGTSDSVATQRPGSKTT